MLLFAMVSTKAIALVINCRNLNKYILVDIAWGLCVIIQKAHDKERLNWVLNRNH